MYMVHTIRAKKMLTDEQTIKLEGTTLPKGYYKKVYRNDIDVVDEHGNYILRFRKNVLPVKNIDHAHDAMIQHARKKTTTRGMTSGNSGHKKLVQYNNPIASNIIGYFDTLSIKQKAYFRDAGLFDSKPICRQTAFTMNHPLKWKQIIPLIKDIDRQYKKLFPKQHSIQHNAAQSTKFVIDNTAFSTITTNLNLQTACHYDKGDFHKGFGNLVVIERGTYKGGYTGFPQYGIAVDVRNGDFLGMDVHQLHGNEPIIPQSNNFERLSLVSYLREGIFQQCKRQPILTDKDFERVRLLASTYRKNNKALQFRKNAQKKILLNRKYRTKKRSNRHKHKHTPSKTKKR